MSYTIQQIQNMTDEELAHYCSNSDDAIVRELAERLQTATDLLNDPDAFNEDDSEDEQRPIRDIFKEETE